MLRPFNLTSPSKTLFALTKLGINSIKTENNFGFDLNTLKIFKQTYISYHKSHFDVKKLWEDDPRPSPDSKIEQHRQSDSLSHEQHARKQVTSEQDELLNSILLDKSNQDSSYDIDWASIKKAVLEVSGTLNEKNIDAVILNKCYQLNSLELGKSYFRYLKSLKTKINRATYGNYLLLFYKCSSQCTDTDINEVSNIYKELLQVHKVLDCYTAEKVVFGISITESWKDYEQLFKTIEMFYYPTPSVYSVVIKTAFRNKNFDIGWKLLEEMQARGINTPEGVFIYILESTENELKEEILSKILRFMGRFNIKPYPELAQVLTLAFESLSGLSKGTYTYVSRSGICKNCNSKLEAAYVNEEDYEKLKMVFLNPVLIGKDIFLKTKPEEFNEFLQFLKKTAPYDVVLDGLNIAYKGKNRIRAPSAFAFQLKSVAKHFCAKDKKVLILGRKHMAKWPSEHMSYIFQSCDVFLADDISEDDPFLLYATLYSGLGTRFVSSDMMRGHKYLLAEPKLQDTFQKWQAQHQYFFSYMEQDGTVHIREPIAFMQNIQQNSKGDWHIPYVTRDLLTNKETVDNFHKKWLCLVNQQKQQVFKNHSTNNKTDRRKYPKLKTAYDFQ